MSTKPNNPKNEEEAGKPFIDLSCYYNDECIETPEDLQTTGISEAEAKKLVDDVFGQLVDNDGEDGTIEAFVDAFFDNAVRNGMNQEETLKMVNDAFDAVNKADD